MGKDNWVKKAYLMAALLAVFAAGHAFADGSIAISKSVVPEVGVPGDTVTVCLTIDPAPLTASAKPADIIFVIDRSGSMSSGVAKLNSNLNAFTAELQSRGIDYRIGLETYVDSSFIGYGFTSDNAVFSAWLTMISYTGSFEPGLEALYMANAFAWRPDASRTMILVTDEAIPCYESSSSPLSLTYTAADLYGQGVKIHAITYNPSIAGVSDLMVKCNPLDLPPLAGGIWVDYELADWSTSLISIAQQIGDYTNVVVRDPLPPELAPIGDVCGATLNGNELVWSLPQVASGSQLLVCCFGATITAAYAGSISNTAYASADGVTETGSNVEYIFYPSPTATLTITETHTVSRTITPTFTPSVTHSITLTSTPTVSNTQTATVTETHTITVTTTPSLTQTVTPTASPTPIPLILQWTGAFPNPGRSHSNVIFSMTRDNPVTVTVFTVSGERVRNEELQGRQGQNRWHWDLLNRSKYPVASGVFIIKIESVDEIYRRHAVLWGKLSVVK